MDRTVDTAAGLNRKRIRTMTASFVTPAKAGVQRGGRRVTQEVRAHTGTDVDGFRLEFTLDVDRGPE
jgi:hypothetical protein